MPRKSELEWSIMENEYIDNPVTLNDLSKKYNISVNALSVRGIKRKWDIRRKKHIEKTCNIIQEGQVDDKIRDDFNLIKQLEKLIKIKTQAELDAFLRYYKITDEGKTLSPKDLMALINKSKDGAAELIKTVELLKGNATERTETLNDISKPTTELSRDIITMLRRN